MCLNSSKQTTAKHILRENTNYVKLFWIC